MGAFALHNGMFSATAFRFIVVALSSLAAAAASPAAAQETSPWDQDGHAAARLIAGTKISDANQSFVHAGLEIRLDSGWKTYWRYPGDSGVPPSLDFAGSQNVKAVMVDWPAPESFDDGAGGHSIGYAGDVILPLRVIPEDATRVPVLRLKLNYAICGKLCVPARAQLELTLSGNKAEEKLIDKAAGLVPQRVALGGRPNNGLAIVSARREHDGNRDRVVVVVAAPEGIPVTLFAEGPTPDWALPLPRETTATRAERRFSFELDGLPPGTNPDGAMLMLTAVAGEKAIEVAVHLD